jgi:hypothetical protein
MDSTPAVTQPSAGRPLGLPAKLTIVALAGIAVATVIGSLIVAGEISLYALALIAIPLALAAQIAAGRRWAPAVAALVSALFLVDVLLFALPILTRPSDPGFVPAVLFVVCAAVAVVAGLAAARAE